MILFLLTIFWVSKLIASHFSITGTPVIITYCAPLTIFTDFDATLTSEWCTGIAANRSYCAISTCSSTYRENYDVKLMKKYKKINYFDKPLLRLHWTRSMFHQLDTPEGNLSTLFHYQHNWCCPNAQEYWYWPSHNRTTCETMHLCEIRLLNTTTRLYVPVGEYPSCVHTTAASLASRPLSHTQPHTPLMQICTFPSNGPCPQTNLTALLVHWDSAREWSFWTLLGAYTYQQKLLVVQQKQEQVQLHPLFVQTL